MAPESTSGLKTVDSFFSWLLKGASRLEIVLRIPDKQYLGEVINLDRETLIDCINTSKPIRIHKCINEVLVPSLVIINSDNIMNFEFSYL